MCYVLSYLSMDLTLNKHGQFCYTYLLGWRNKDIWYYGSRGANKLPPEEDLLNKYPTSSKYVKEFIAEYGQPDVVRIHKLFMDYSSARQHESKFLSRVKADISLRWLNRHTGPGNYVTTGPHLQSTKDKISKANRGKKRSNQTRELQSEKRKVYCKTEDGKLHIQKMILARESLPNPCLGKFRSEEFKHKMSETISAQFANGRTAHNKGKSCSPEQRERLSMLRKGKTNNADHNKKNSERIKLWWSLGRPKGGLKALP